MCGSSFHSRLHPGAFAPQPQLRFEGVQSMAPGLTVQHVPMAQPRLGTLKGRVERAREPGRPDPLTQEVLQQAFDAGEGGDERRRLAAAGG